jgi:predicted flap endonuclease-1-like 5' DNA nuclease
MSSFWCSFLPIVVGIGSALLGGLIGWYLRRTRFNELEDIVDEKNADYAHLKNAHEMLDIRHNNLQREHTALSLSHNSLNEKTSILEQDYANLSTSQSIFGEKTGILEEDYTALVTAHNKLKVELLQEDLAAVENAKAIVTKHFVNYRTTTENRVEELEKVSKEWEQKYTFLHARYDSQNSRLSELEKVEEYANFLKIEKERSTKRITDLQDEKEEWESSYRKLFSENKTNLTRISDMQVLVEQTESDNLSLFNKIETLQQTIIPSEITNQPQNDIDSRIKLYEKELIELQDAKAQLEINRIKLENDLDILRGSHTETLMQYKDLIELEKVSRLRLEYLEKQNFEHRIVALEVELETYKVKILSENGHVAEELMPIASTPVQVDDLKVVEGIGPKIEAVLHEAGILTFEQLAKADPEHINAILDAAGPRYRIHNPATWPTQAELAAKNDWDKLKELKDQLLGGRDRATN